jgi:4-hydroxythreonine-4-phosphate dehydrogenase
VTDVPASPALAITLGDPTGIGPEVVAGALAAQTDTVLRRIRVHGDPEVLERAARAMGVESPAVVFAPSASFGPHQPGHPDEAAGVAQVSWLEDAIASARRGEVAALVTAPISKTWARRAGFAFPGHTELLAERFGGAEVAMMFAGPRLKVVLATVHVPLRDVARTLDPSRIATVTALLGRALRDDFGVAAPRIGVVGLNPHAGEGGLLGKEEHEVIAPAIGLARAAAPGLTITGPLVPDVAFRDALDGRHDGLVAMYHDQALIPVKLVDFESAVNVTLGLPIVRTSPDHGTAYDIAGQGKARSASFAAALRLAVEMIDRRSELRTGPSALPSPK